ncbi:importin subunit alpha-1 [Capsella rubella]|uniref:importin subunit alpha-1 n=1 Tax=Capsella rubella TaxID=81985 RepID=UPI000CD4E5F1|nr:importin subunit alpha-1 [Capsella rubella]
MALNPKAKKEVTQEMLDGVFSKDPSIQFKYASMFEKGNIPIDEIVNSGVVPRFIEFLKKEDSVMFQYVAASVLRHVSQKNTKVLIDHGAVQIFIHLLAGATDDSDVHFQVIYLLNNENIQSFIDAGLVQRLVQLLGHVSPMVIVLALSIILDLTNGDNQQTQVVIDHGVLPLLANLFTRNHVTQWKTCWTISNITAGTEEQIQSVIDANLIPTLVSLAQNAEIMIKEKAVCAISNATSGGSHDQIKYLVKQGCIKLLCDLLDMDKPGIVLKCLNGLENILRAGDVEEEDYSQMIEDAEGLEKILKLKHHRSNEIYEKALEILETYWKEEDDDDDGEQTQQPLK